MTMNTLIDHASAIMTVLSLFTFLGILWWVWLYKKSGDFDDMAYLPLAEEDDINLISVEKHHG